MFTLPTALEEKLDRVDRQRSRAIGIGSAVVAAWCAYRLVWLVYLMATFGGFLGGSLAFSFVLWGVIGVVAAAAAVIFLQRAKHLGAAAEGTPSVTTEA